MNLHEERYARFALVREMLETVDIIRDFKTSNLSDVAAAISKNGKLFLTGEGSSRIFPAKNAIHVARQNRLPLTICTEGSRQAAELDLSEFILFGASNSGKTKEVISLFHDCPAMKKYALTAFAGTPLEKLSATAFILNCGKEDAVAATKSVIEQALFYHQLLMAIAGKTITTAELHQLAEYSRQVLELNIPPEITSKLKSVPVIYFAGRNVGVAEEATLKTNEITRKKSAYLEGTYAVHGIEEVMEPGETVAVIDPFVAEEQKFKEVLVDGVGLNVIAIAGRDTLFPTIKIPVMAGFDHYLQLQTCWNLLIEVGIAAGVNLDKPERARKVGNEFII